MTTYSCTRCGMSTPPQPENPYPASHPLGRFCVSCLPALLEGLANGMTTRELIAEAAQHRMGCGKELVDVPANEYMDVHLDYPLWIPEEKDA